MSDELFEQRLRRRYREEVAGVTTPDDLRASVLEIPDQAGPALGVRPRFQRNWTLMAAAALLAVGSLLGALVAGSAITRVRSVATPLPSPPPVAQATPTPTPSPTPQPTVPPEPTATPLVLPAGLIAAYHSLGDTAEIVTIDPVTSEQVVIGTMPVALQPSDPNVFADTFGPGYVGVRWASDRRLVTVFRDEDAERAIAQIDVVTGDLQSISVSDDTYVSPDGTLLATFGYDPQAVVIETLSGDVVNRVELPAGTYYSGLMWAPDDSAVIVGGFTPPTSLSSGGNGNGQVFANTSTGPGWVLVVPIDGSSSTRLGGSPDVSLGNGTMSPDMTKIVAARSCQPDAPRDCVAGLTVIDVGTKGITQLTTDLDDFNAQWSPDGSRISFERTSGAGRGVWVMNADGSQLIHVATSDRRHIDHSIAWAPDGTRIVFTRSNANGSEGRLGDVYVVPSSGGEPQLLISDAVADW